MTVKSLTLAVAVLGTVALALPAAAAPACKEGVTATGRAANPKNYDPPKKYDMRKEAEKRAVAAWSKDVRDRCGTHSAFWWRATAKKISCEGYAGGTVCTVTAIPAKKVL